MKNELFSNPILSPKSNTKYKPKTLSRSLVCCSHPKKNVEMLLLNCFSFFFLCYFSFLISTPLVQRMYNFFRCWPELFCSSSSVEHNSTWKRQKCPLQGMGWIPAVSPLSSGTIYEGLGFLQDDVVEYGTWNMEYGIWAGFQSIQEINSGVNSVPMALEAPVDNPHWLHQVGKWAEGRRSELCSLLITKLHQKA